MKSLFACIALVLISATSAAGAEALFQQRFDGPEPLAGWSFPKDWMKNNFSRQTEDGEAFLRMEQARAIAHRSIAIPGGVGEIVVSARFRASGLEGGENPWDIPMIQVTLSTGGGEALNKPWPTAIKVRADTEGWMTQASRIPIPEGADTAQIALSYKAKAGTFDLAEVALHDSAKAPAGLLSTAAEPPTAGARSAAAPHPKGDLGFLGVVRGTVVQPWDGRTIGLELAFIQQYTVLDNPEHYLGKTVHFHAERITRSDSDAAIEDYKTFLGTLATGDEQELAVVGSLDTGRLFMVRMPGPLTHPMGKDAPHLRSQLDESTVTEEVRIDAENGPFKTFEEGMVHARSEFLDKGIGVRVTIAPGRYQVTQTVLLHDLSDDAKQAPLIIEGDEENAVVITGAELLDAAGWEALDAARGIYRRDWDKGHGNDPQTGYYTYHNVLHHRLDHMAVNGRAIYPRLIDDFDYIDPKGKKYDEAIGLALEGGGKVVGKTGYVFKGFHDPVETLQPGEFGIAELGPGDPLFDANPHAYPKSLFIRLPQGVHSIADAKVEISMCASAIHLDDKSNVTLRNLNFEMFHGSNRPDRRPRGAVDVNYFSDFHATRNYRIENCHFSLDRKVPLTLAWVTGFEIRNSTFNHNPGLGIRTLFVRDGIIESCTFNHNHGGGEHIFKLEGDKLRGHGTGGFSFNGMNMTLLDCQMKDNFGCGLRSDFGMYDVLFERCEVTGSRDPNRHAVFHEIEFGPATWRNSRIVDNNGSMGFGMLNVHRVTIENTIIANNDGPQITLYHSPKRGTSTRPLDVDGVEHETPIRLVEGLRIFDSTIAATGDDALISPTIGAGAIRYFVPLISGSDTGDVMGIDYEGDRNTFWNPDRTEAFNISTEYDEQTWTDLEGWQELTGQDQNSIWGPPMDADLGRPGE